MEIKDLHRHSVPMNFYERETSSEGNVTVANDSVC